MKWEYRVMPFSLADRFSNKKVRGEAQGVGALVVLEAASRGLVAGFGGVQGHSIVVTGIFDGGDLTACQPDTDGDGSVTDDKVSAG